MVQRATAGSLRALKYWWWAFFYQRCLSGFPWFWPARTPGVPAMVAARRIIRQQFGRDHHFAYRALAKVFTTIIWPPAVLIHLWEIRYFRGSDFSAAKAGSWGALGCLAT